MLTYSRTLRSTIQQSEAPAVAYRVLGTATRRTVAAAEGQRRDRRRTSFPVKEEPNVIECTQGGRRPRPIMVHHRGNFDVVG